LFDNAPFPQALVEVYSSSENLEVQGRACEYKRTFGHEAIRSQLFEHMPALDESTYTRRGLCARLSQHCLCSGSAKNQRVISRLSGLCWSKVQHRQIGLARFHGSASARIGFAVPMSAELDTTHRARLLA